MIQADIIITDLMDSDISIHFVTPELYNQFMWSPDEEFKIGHIMNLERN